VGDLQYRLAEATRAVGGWSSTITPTARTECAPRCRAAVELRQASAAEAQHKQEELAACERVLRHIGGAG
jgi:hypothetical protein